MSAYHHASRLDALFAGCLLVIHMAYWVAWMMHPEFAKIFVNAGRKQVLVFMFARMGIAAATYAGASVLLRRWFAYAGYVTCVVILVVVCETVDVAVTLPVYASSGPLFFALQYMTHASGIAFMTVCLLQCRRRIVAAVQQAMQQVV
jgi:hypothetical protein